MRLNFAAMKESCGKEDATKSNFSSSRGKSIRKVLAADYYFKPLSELAVMREQGQLTLSWK